MSQRRSRRSWRQVLVKLKKRCLRPTGPPKQDSLASARAAHCLDLEIQTASLDAAPFGGPLYQRDTLSEPLEH